MCTLGCQALRRGPHMAAPLLAAVKGALHARGSEMKEWAALLVYTSAAVRRRCCVRAHRPERPQTTSEREKENMTAVAAQPSWTMRGSPCREHGASP